MGQLARQVRRLGGLRLVPTRRHVPPVGMVRVMAYLDHPTTARAASRTTLGDTEGPIRLRNRAGHWGAFAECEAVTFFELDLGPDGNQLCIGQFGPRGQVQR